MNSFLFILRKYLTRLVSFVESLRSQVVRIDEFTFGLYF